jgi:hypothetical protein
MLMKKKLLTALCLLLSVLTLTACAAAPQPSSVTLQIPADIIGEFEMRRDGKETEVIKYTVTNEGETGYKLTVVKTTKDSLGTVTSTRTDEVFMQGQTLIPTASNGSYVTTDVNQNWNYQGTYTGSKISVVANYKGANIENKLYEKALPQSIFYDGQSYPVILRAFPLAADYKAVIYLVMANGTTYDGINLAVTDSTVTVKNEGKTDKPYEAFKVVLTPFNSSAAPVTLWYDKADKKLLCFQQTLGDVTTTFYSVLPE